MPSQANFLFTLASIATTVACWGAYGPVLHKGQFAMGQGRLRPFICVGIAYFVISIVVPIVLLTLANWESEPTKRWNFSGVVWSLAGGTAGAIGALGIIMAMTYGGPNARYYVMPIVFGCAPVVTVATTMFLDRMAGKSIGAISPFFAAGLILVAAGATTVLVFQPKAEAAPKPAVKDDASTNPLAPGKNAAEEKAAAEKDAK